MSPYRRASVGHAESSGLITLLTDFGLSDPFVGIMHGVILSRFPAARIVDLSHGVAPQAVDEAAFWLERTCQWFPPGTVHVAVVDPGVGTPRAALLVAVRERLFIAPDNGLVGDLANEAGAAVRHIDLERVGLQSPSRTFHGRDVFAPVAAEIAAGRLAFADVGPSGTAQRLERPPVQRRGGMLVGRIVSIDHFGNLITNIEAGEGEAFSRPVVVIKQGEVPVAGTYAEVPEDEPLAVVSSFGTLEVAVRNGNAAAYFGVARGAEVVLREARPRVL